MTRLLAIVIGIAAACSSNQHAGTTTPDAPHGITDAAKSGTDAAPTTTVGCGSSSLFTDPADYSAAGPWPVGARTVTVGGLTTEIWYPAVPGSQQGSATAQYDIRTELPPSEAAKIPDAANPLAPCDCYRDLPFDAAHGPYPVVLFVHGTAAFRFQSMHFMTHWASRGFVVVAADHPGLKLADILGVACGSAAVAQDLSGNLDTLIAALAAPSGDLAFLAGHLDTARIAVTGHSAGAAAAASASTKPGVEVVISMAGIQAAAASSSLRSSLFFGGLVDMIAQWANVQTAYNGSPTPRRLVGIANGGHLTFSDLCQISNSAGQNILQVAQAYNVCGASLAGLLFDCSASHIDGPTGWNIVNYASSAVLENTLQCGSAIDLSQLSTIYPDVMQYQQSL